MLRNALDNAVYHLQKVVIRLLKGSGEVSFAAMVVRKLFRWNSPMSPVKCCSR